MTILLTTALVSLLTACGAEPQQQAQEQPAAAHVIAPESAAAAQKGQQAYEAFQYDAAIAYYDRALAEDDRNDEALAGKGIALAMRGNETGSQQDKDEALTLIKESLALNADNTAAFYDLALAYKINGQYEEAERWFKMVIEKEPDKTWSYYGIATIYGDLGKADAAVFYLEKAITYGGDAVKDAARSQHHFDAVRSNAAFRELIR